MYILYRYPTHILYCISYFVIIIEPPNGPNLPTFMGCTNRQSLTDVGHLD